MNTKSIRRALGLLGLPVLPVLRLTALTSALMLALPAWSFTSGSTGADGPFNPTINTAVQLPPSGVLNYTTINIPTGVTVTFLKNATNTPAVILASGDVTVAGIIDIRGKNSADVGAAGNGNLGDDGLPGDSGPGGYAGGTGGKPATAFADRDGGHGQGPGAGGRGAGTTSSVRGGGGAGYGAVGANNAWNSAVVGAVYGSAALLPLIGGSGGGGGAAGVSFSAAGGGGGGGALLIAASGTVTVTGSILASGGSSGASSGSGCGATGGGGSGGAIRLVATTIVGNGAVTAINGLTAANGCDGNGYGGNGGVGRVRMEAETFTRTAASNPVHAFSAPGQVFVAGVPTLSITSVAGTNAPASPTGNADITLPTTTVNPVTVVFQTTGVPVGNNVKLTVTPAYGATVTAVSPAITGTTTLGNASVPVSLPSGPSTLLAQTTYTITVAMGQALSMFAQNEQVERVEIKAVPGKANQYFLVTVSGKEYEVPLARLVGII